MTETREHTVTFTTRSMLRTGSFVAGLISVGWGVYVLQAVQFAGTSTTTGNLYANYIFVLSSMFEAMIVGLFAVLLAILGR